MKELSKKLHKQALETMKPLIAQLVSEGLDKGKIVQTTKRYAESKVNAYYAKMTSMGGLFGPVVNKLKRGVADSKAEVIFFRMLKDAKISFEFQFPIGPYFADYLVGGNLVVELDGPQHDKVKDERRDKYLRKMGYKVLRLPIIVVALTPELVIDEIKSLLQP